MNLKTQNSHTTDKVYRDNSISKFLKLIGIKEKINPQAQDETEIKELVESIRHARSQWITANMNFEHANEFEMVDFYTYQIKACEIRYEYLIKKAKESGIKVEMLENMGLSLKINDMC